MGRICRIVVIGLLASGLLACEPSPISIPSGAHQVHVTATTSAVHLDPTTVPAGDVYLVLDLAGGSVDFIQTQTAADASPGPLSAADLTRLAQGDTESTRTENLSVGCCGNVVKKTLAPGSYAFEPGGTGDGTPPPSIAVLEVGP